MTIEIETVAEVVLDVNDTDLVSEELYDMLLDAFLEKARRMGHDVANSPDLVLGDWTLKSTLERV
jgi:hypothetical protein